MPQVRPGTTEVMPLGQHEGTEYIPSAELIKRESLAQTAKLTRGGRRFQAEEAGKGRAFQAGQSEFQRIHASRQGELQRAHELTRERETFERKSAFAQPYLQQFGEEIPYESTEPGESEQILIQAQEEAAEKDVNRLQDILSGAGILSSGTLAVGTGEILGATRGQVAQTSAGFAEQRLTRRHQQRLAQRQQLTSLIQSILG